MYYSRRPASGFQHPKHGTSLLSERSSAPLRRLGWDRTGFSTVGCDAMREKSGSGGATPRDVTRPPPRAGRAKVVWWFSVFGPPFPATGRKRIICIWK